MMASASLGRSGARASSPSRRPDHAALETTHDQVDRRSHKNAQTIVCKQQLALACYVADRGDVCIRQEDLGSEEGYDVCVFIRPEHVPALIRRLQQLVK
jgi:hypothetical protein